MPPPTAEPLASRVLLGPALRTQPDRRLVRLVREGYETAFEEIVRRYRKPLDRFAASIVGSRAEDVTQDAFSKALLALRGSENEIELKPWLYRIVRNTALNDLRDRPPTVEQLEETLAGGESAAVAVERREEMTELMERLRALPEPQRAAIVMRELEGLSHEEIGAALGVSGGAARQAIHRARVSLRNGIGLLLPLPLLRALFDHGAEAAGGAAAAGAAAGGMSLGGIGAGGAAKAGLATVLIAGSVGAGVAVQHERSPNSGPEQAEAAVGAARLGDDSGGSPGSSNSGPSGGGELEPGDDHGGRGEVEPGDDHGGRGDEPGDDRRGSNRGPDGDNEDRSGHRGGEVERSGSSGSSERSGSSSSGSGGSSGSGSSGSGSSGSGSGGEVSDDSGGGSSGSDSGSSGSGGGDSGSSGSDGSGSDD